MADTRECYYPAGNVVPGDTPCGPSTIGHSESACCSSSDICLDNGLCLYQHGAEVVKRKSCTDKTWQSSDCPQYCADVTGHNEAWMFLVFAENRAMFCCSNMNLSNSSCVTSTKGSFSPFLIEAGLVINNRTSGSTFPNNTDTVTVVTTATVASATISTLSSIPATLSSPSSRRDAGIAAGVSALLGLGLLVALGVLWKQRKHKQSLKKDVQIWKDKYSGLMETTTVNIDGVNQHPPHQLDGWSPDELDGQPRLPAQLEGWMPDEVDGTEVYGAASRVG